MEQYENYAVELNNLISPTIPKHDILSNTKKMESFRKVLLSYSYRRHYTSHDF